MCCFRKLNAVRPASGKATQLARYNNISVHLVQSYGRVNL